MGGRWALALSAMAVGVAGAYATDRCELQRVDRATTASSFCMQCHDGNAGAAIPISKDVSHPVGVDYGDVAAAHPTRYAPAGGLPAAVPLVNGRVECTSCHDGASTAPKHVVDPPQLCNACHVL